MSRSLLPASASIAPSQSPLLRPRPLPLACPADWLHTEQADRALASFNAKADPGCRPLAKEAYFQEDAGVEVGGWVLMGGWVGSS
jgi:hypothetical protein